MAISYPLTVTFRVVTLSPEVSVKDAAGNLMLQVKQKLLTLREDTTVYADAAKTTPVYRMKADRVMGFNAVHHITRLSDNAVIGAVKRRGMKSLFQARYDVTDGNDKSVFMIREESAWLHFLDAFLGEIDLIGPLLAYLINPRYLLTDEHGTLRFRITKRRSFLERRFFLEQVSSEEDDALDERLVALALIQVVLLERQRG